MLNSTLELFLSEYFFIKAVLGKYLEDGKKLFCGLSKIFLIPEADADELYPLTENDIARTVTTEKEFMQYQRMQKYSELIGSPTQANAEWEEVTTVKGNAILTAQNQNLIEKTDATRNAVFNAISSAAKSGLISALRIAGFLQCEGIFFAKNMKAGITMLTKAANWNDVVSSLALIHYCKDARMFNVARLRQEVADMPYEDLYAAVSERYGEADASIPEVRLLEKAFNSGVLKRDVYNPKYARVLNSRALYFKDKEKTIYTQNKDLVGVIGDLPLKLSVETMAPVDVSPVLNVTLKREAEALAIVRALNNGDLRELASYRPICLCSNSRYVLNMYADAIAGKRANTHVEIIDVAELNEYDFEPTPNNVFVRSIDEDKDNRFLLYFFGDVSDRKIELARSVLQSGKRAKFHLNSPNVTLNLSAVLPICFCDERNAKLLSEYCDVIQLAEVAADEKAAAINDILARAKNTYGVKDVNLGGGVDELFEGYDVDAAEKLIDAAVRAHREKNAAITLTRETLQELSLKDKSPMMGFGGNINEKH